jgi:hypothetical protein
MNENDDVEFSKVPADFPCSIALSALPGTQPKFLATNYKGKFYPPGCAPPELYERWRICDEIVKEISSKALESKKGKRSHMNEVEILDYYLLRLLKTLWTSEAETRWIILRVAENLRWPVPSSALIFS